MLNNKFQEQNNNFEMDSSVKIQALIYQQLTLDNSHNTSTASIASSQMMTDHQHQHHMLQNKQDNTSGSGASRNYSEEQQQSHETSPAISQFNPGKLMSLTEEQIQQLQNILGNNGVPIFSPTLTLQMVKPYHNLTETQRLTLDKDDIIKVFQVFGEVAQVVVNQDVYNSNVQQQDSALITFKDTISAYFAQISLNGHYLKKYDLQLKVQWLHKSDSDRINFSGQMNESTRTTSELFNNCHQTIPQMIPSQTALHQESLSTTSSSSQSMSPESHNHRPQLVPQLQSTNLISSSSSSYNFTPVLPQQQQQYKQTTANNSVAPQSFYPSSSGASSQNQYMCNYQQASVEQDCASHAKYTCRFEIQIPNDKEFQVARRLIGAKGSNMKRIIENCCRKTGGQPDAVKLRLRGIGSGFREGPRQEESCEPLHLCISSKDQEMYNEACNSVEQLLTQVYQEYRRFTNKSQNKRDHNNQRELLQVKKIEQVSGIRNKTTQQQQQNSPALSYTPLQSLQAPVFQPTQSYLTAAADPSLQNVNFEAQQNNSQNLHHQSQGSLTFNCESFVPSNNIRTSLR